MATERSGMEMFVEIVVSMQPVLVTALLLIAFDHFIRLLRLPELTGRAVLVTGCDSGFGKELVMELNDLKIPTFACCLSERSVQELRSRGGADGLLTVLQMDIRDQHSVDTAYDLVKKTLVGQELWTVVNNAGVPGAGFCDDWLTVDDYRTAMEVNFFGAVRVTHAFKPLIKQSRGRFVFMTSVLGRVAVPMTGPYCASKFALEAYCDVLRKELIPWHVGVYILEPGFFTTALTDPVAKRQEWERHIKTVDEAALDEYEESFVTQGYEGQKFLLDIFCSKDTSQVTDAYLHAITARFPRYRYIIGLQTKLLILPFAYLPSFASDLMAIVLYGFTFGWFKRSVPGTSK